jgi:hypothetical protein
MLLVPQRCTVARMHRVSVEGEREVGDRVRCRYCVPHEELHRRADASWSASTTKVNAGKKSSIGFAPLCSIVHRYLVWVDRVVVGGCTGAAVLRARGRRRSRDCTIRIVRWGLDTNVLKSWESDSNQMVGGSSWYPFAAHDLGHRILIRWSIFHTGS